VRTNGRDIFKEGSHAKYVISAFVMSQIAKKPTSRASCSMWTAFSTRPSNRVHLLNRSQFAATFTTIPVSNDE